MRRQQIHRRVQRESERYEVTTLTTWESLLLEAGRLGRLPVRNVAYATWPEAFREAERLAKINGEAVVVRGSESWWAMSL